MKVWKFSIGPPDAKGLATIQAPVDAHLLAPGVQGGALHVWGVVADATTVATRQLLVVNTGAAFDYPGEVRYLGTVTVVGESVYYPDIVWHVWEVLG